MEAFKEFLKRNRFLLIGGGLGLIAAILMLTIGFFPTILIAALIGLGCLIGGKPQAFVTIKAWFITLFKKIFKGKQK